MTERISVTCAISCSLSALLPCRSRLNHEIGINLKLVPTRVKDPVELDA